MTGQSYGMYYNADPLMKEIFPAFVNPQYIDSPMTEKIKEHIRSRCATTFYIDEGINDNCNDEGTAFERLGFIYSAINACNDVQNPYLVLDSFVKNVLALYNLQSQHSFIAFQLKDDDGILNGQYINGKKYLICAYAHTILIFVDPGNMPYQFLFALYPEALTFSFSTQLVEKEMIVWETSKEPIEYYDKFSPAPDSKIVSRSWRRTNRDGSRSFAGGLKPEHNPLLFLLEYGVISIEICSNIRLQVSFSNGSLSQAFGREYEAYQNSKVLFPRNRNLQQDQHYQQALDFMKSIYYPVKRNRSFSEWFRSLSPAVQLLVIIGGCFVGILAILFWLKFIGTILS